MAIKGQNLRMTFGTAQKYVAAATNATVHVSSNLEDSSTKDSTGNATEQEMTSYSYDLSSESLFTVSGDTTGASTFDLLKAQLAGKKVKWEMDLAGGEQNRVAQTGSHKIGGTVIFNDTSIGAQNRQNSTAQFQAQGTGPLLIDGKEITEATELDTTE